MGEKIIKDSMMKNRDYAIGADIVLFMIHLILLGLFWILQAKVMFVVNIFSVLIYLILFPISIKNPSAFLLLSYVEIVIHMIFAVITMGWDCGFQLYCFSLLPLIYYCDYLRRAMKKEGVHPTFIGVCVAAIFLFLRIWTSRYASIYEILDPSLKMKIYLGNAVLIIGFVLFYMANYKQLTMETEAELKDNAETDELTGMNNRRVMIEQLQEVLTQCSQALAQGTHGTPDKNEMAVCILDIDDFKFVNDNYGHNAGDYILKQLAAEIMAMESETILTCRWGGEEFVILSKGEAAYQHLYMLISELVVRVENMNCRFAQKTIPVTITAGIARYQGEASVQQLIGKADHNLYIGKQNGKNCLVDETISRSRNGENGNASN